MNSFFRRIIRIPVTNTLSFLSFIISILGIIFSIYSYNLSKRQYEISQIPYWEMKLNYADNNHDLNSIEFKSLSPGVILQKIHILYPSGLESLRDSVILGNIWKCYNFSNYIYEAVEKFYDIPNVNFNLSLPLDYTFSYPLGLKFDYLQNGEQKSSFNLYKIHIKVYSQSLFKLTYFETKLINLQNSDLFYAELLDNLDRDECLLAEMINNDTSKYASLYSKSVYYYYLNHMSKLTRSLEEALPKDSLCGCLSNEALTMPLFAVLKSSNTEFLTNLEIVSKHIDVFPRKIRRNIKEINSLIEQYPVCETMEKNCIEKSIWKTKMVQSKLNKIINDVKREENELVN